MAALPPDQIDRYLARIGLTGPLPPTAETLAAIQSAHLHAVPFENLDICPLESPISLDVPAIYEKIVERRRGGFCYEQNSLLAAALAGMGYRVARHAAHFTDDPAAETDPFDHLVLMVTVPEDGSVWYADVAAGRQNPPHPVPVAGLSAAGRHRLRREDEWWHLEQRGEEGDWLPVLAWDATERQIAEFVPRCEHFQRDPESFFRQGAMVTMLCPGGRVTLSKRMLITTVDGVREEREIGSDTEIAAILQETFGIEIPVDERWR